MANAISIEPLTVERLRSISRELKPIVNQLMEIEKEFSALDRTHVASASRVFADGVGAAIRSATDRKKEALAATMRSGKEAAEQIVAPVWEHLGQFELLSDQVQARPRALRGAGAALLPHIAEIALLEGGDVMAKALIKWAVDRRTAASDVLSWNEHALRASGWLDQDTYLQLLATCLTDSEINVSVEMQTRGLGEFLSFCSDWVNEREGRRVLANAGTPVGRTEEGEIRNMDPDSFPALGEYLGCCIGNDEHGPAYVERCEAGEAVYLCIYGEKGVPVLLVEVFLDAYFSFGDIQSRFERGGDRGETLGHLKDWLQSEGRQALGLDPTSSATTTPAPLPAKPDQQQRHRPVKPQQD